MDSPPLETHSIRPSPWAPGTIIAGKYRLVSPIGAGGMGQVWRAEHLTLGSMVAVKLVDVASSPNPQETMARFLHEARAAAKLKNAHVVQTLDHGSQGHVAYIVMELLEGMSLAKKLERLRVLAAPDVVRVFREIARALEKAHAQGIVHRDLKPENVFLAVEDGREVVKLLDFGIAKTAEGAHDPHLKTHAGTVVGTPSYMSPEQVMGKPLDHRSDLWQVAMIAYECVTGQRAFSGNSLGELFMKICTAPLPVPSHVTKVPVGFDAWFARAAQRDPNARFQSIRELAETLALVILRASPGGPATVPVGANGTEVLGSDAQQAALSRGPSTTSSPIVPILLVVVPIFLVGIAGAIWILRGKDDVAPALSPSAMAITPEQPSLSAAIVPQPVPRVSATAPAPTDEQDAGASSVQNVPDAGKGNRVVKPKKDDDLGF